MLDPTIQGGGGILGTPSLRTMINIRKSPMDMNKNRYEKLVQTPSRGAEGASPECVTIEQCQSAYRQSMKTTVTEVFGNLAEKTRTDPRSGDGGGGRGDRYRRYYECTGSVDRS